MLPSLSCCIGLGCTGIFIMLIKRYMAGPVCLSKTLLIGKTVIITGANSGIGKATALELAKRKARVILACRNIKYARQTARDITRQVPSADVVCKHLDLASLNNINKFAKEIILEEREVNILINNAGIGMCPYQLTNDGFEMQMGVNHLGHFYLTNLLLDKIKQSTSCRILIVTSMLARHGLINLNQINNSQETYNKHAAYHNSKLANNLFCRKLSAQLEGTGIGVFAISPGIVYTNLIRHSSTLLKTLGSPIAWLFFRSPTSGSQTIIHCAVEEKLNDPLCSGKFYRDCKQKRWDDKSLDDVKAEQLWKLSEKLVGLD